MSSRMTVRWFPTLSRAALCMFLWGLQSSSRTEGFIFYPYIFDATEEPTYAEYDYVVVGGGAAGCPLAATLSEKYKVLLLERGGVPYDQPSVYRVEGYPWVLNTRAAEKFSSVDGVQLRRGAVLGGGTSVNAGLYSRAPSDFIADAGWDTTEVESAYEWVERVVSHEPKVKQWQSAWRDALLEAGVGPYNGYTKSHVIGTKLASSLFDRTGTRHTSADLLQNGVSDNQRVLIFAQVHRVLFNTSDSLPRAYGVEYTDSKGVRHLAAIKPGGEVLLTAGAIGSTQLLLLSGVGPADKLDPWHLTQIAKLDSVGRNVTDIPINPVGVLSPRPVETSPLEIVGITPENIFESGSGGNQSICYPQAGELNNLPPAGRSEAYDNSVGKALASVPRILKDTINQAGNMIQKVYRPHSRGTLKLASADVTQAPIVKYNYLSDPRDVKMCVNGVNILSAVINSKAMSNYTYRFGAPPILGLIPGYNISVVGPILPNIKNHTESAQWCKDTVTTIWHFHGGCRRSDCVDSDYHVMGTKNLRVVDGSTWLTSPGTNPQATCMMLGRYVGRQILKERGPGT